jgi:hypothetical protein
VVNAAGEPKIHHGVWVTLLPAIEAVSIHRSAGVVAGLKVNAVAAADFQHSSHFAGGGQNAVEFDAAGALANLFTNFAPVASYQRHR